MSNNHSQKQKETTINTSRLSSIGVLEERDLPSYMLRSDIVKMNTTREMNKTQFNHCQGKPCEDDMFFLDLVGKEVFKRKSEDMYRRAYANFMDVEQFVKCINLLQLKCERSYKLTHEDLNLKNNLILMFKDFHGKLTKLEGKAGGTKKRQTIFGIMPAKNQKESDDMIAKIEQEIEDHEGNQFLVKLDKMVHRVQTFRRHFDWK